MLEGAASSLVSKSYLRAFGTGGIIGFYSSSTSPRWRVPKVDGFDVGPEFQHVSPRAQPVASCLRRLRCSGSFFERCDRVFRLVENLKHCHELCNLKQLVCMTTEVGKLDVTADLPSRCVQTHQGTQAAAIDVSNVPEVEHDLVGFVQRGLHKKAQRCRFFAKEDGAAEIDDDDSIYLAGSGVKGHENLPPLSRGARERSEERRVGKECRSRWSPYH